ncbi:MAG: DUF4260 domain-containing protein [Anaerolineae bacterium]|nr:DUF4260 domain-containing protein [Anaerolineae bacterium]
MKNIIKIEEFFLFALGVYLFSQLDYAWWVFWALLLAPDLGALGYLGGTRLGAWTYNLVHHRGVAVGLYLLGIYLESPALQLTGVMMLSHSSLDRAFGYGLKYPDSFQHTHLGMVGRSEKSS